MTVQNLQHLSAASERGTNPADMPRPHSAVSDWTGLSGLAGLFAGLVAAAHLGLQDLGAVFLVVAACALPMILVTIVVEKAHLNSSTGIDYTLKRPVAEVVQIMVVKLVGLTTTLLLAAGIYFVVRTYQSDSYSLYLRLASASVPLLFLFAPLYIAFTTRSMVEPRDELWHFGSLVLCNFADVDREKIRDHLLAWAVKVFFLAFMVSILPGNILSVIRVDVSPLSGNPVQLMGFLLQLTFLADVCIGMVGYVLTFRVLDSHIRTANPHLSAWVVALICYPPFVLMGDGGPLDYRAHGLEWSYWLDGHPILLFAWGTAIVLLGVIYAWATVVFGIRFSNLTHRGIITAGPYRYFRHPAYLSKNLMWWMVHMPFLSTTGTDEAVRNTLLLIATNAVYYARAKTEERHLRSDPQYRAYCEWISLNGLLERVLAKLRHLRGSSVI